MIGEVLNNYRVISLLGEGGMGAVYLAEHPFMGRKAAIKVLRREFAEDRSLVERFMNEARAANAIRHPNIIDIIDVGRLPSGIPYLMMEFLDGVSLLKRIQQVGQMGAREAVEIAIQTTAALAAAHSKGIVHRDLKPDNLFLIPDDSRASGQRVKLLDFGIAKLRGDLASSVHKTQSGLLMGTPPYMSPEQCRGVTDEIDHRTDVYALGIILYEMLCGAPPFVFVGWGEIVLAHITQAPVPPRARNPLVPQAVEAVILKALAKTREERFQSMTDMQAALRFTDSLVQAGSLEVAAAPAPTVMRSPSATMPAPPPTTTFRSAAGEVTPPSGYLPTMQELDLPGPGRNGRIRWLVGSAAVALAAMIAVTVASGKRLPRPPHEGGVADPEVTVVVAPESPRVPTVAAAPVSAAPAPADPAPSPMAVEMSAPAVPAAVRLKIDSDPAGAQVTDARKGTVLGTTPFDKRVDRDRSPLDLRVAKGGFQAASLSVPRDRDFETSVHLDRVRHAARREPRAAAAPASSPAPARSVAVPAAAPPSPAPRPRAVEKW
ncbi:MAG TPA: serine/threonine-protein kinase [Polyangia bacterium]|nr:serine/threonine-protein kinase [Polyangia bacterium]